MKKILSTLFVLFILTLNLFLPISVFADQPTIDSLTLTSSQQSSSNSKWFWEFELLTKNTPDGTGVIIDIWKENIKEITISNKKIQGNWLSFNTGYILENNTNYSIHFTLKNTNPTVKEIYTQKTGGLNTTGSPVILSFFPTHGFVSGNNGVTITGINFSGTTKVLFGEKEGINLSVESPTSIYIEVPPGAITGKIKIQTPKGDAVSSNDFEIRPDPVAYFDPNKSSLTNNKYRLLAPIGSFDEAPDNIGDYFNIIFLIAIGLCAVLAVIMIVIGGIQYMGDESIFGKTEAKDRITKAILGLLIALGSYALLNTINPDLLGGGGVNIKQVTAEIVYDRANDTAFMQNLDSYSTSNITINPSDYNDPIFLGYMAHQQGSAGASAILWAAKKGYTEVPAKNPFTKSDINRNMKGNFNTNSAQQTIGTAVLTPDNFLKYWATKVVAVKNKTTPAIFPAIETELNKVATETGVGIITLRTICRIESAAGCTQQSSITTVNSGGYAGLFQLSNKTYQTNRTTDGVWETHKKSNGILLDAYHNAFAAAKYFSANLSSINKNMSKINN